MNFLSNYGIFGIMIAGFFEGIFMPFPMDLITIPAYLANTNKVFIYLMAMLTFSFLGTIISYFTGKYLGNIAVKKIISGDTLNKVGKLYEKNVALTVLSSSITPIPYEAFTYSAGIFKVDFKKFIIFAFFSRVIRHIPQAILISLYGESIVANLKKVTLIVGIILVIVVSIYLIVKKRK